MKMFAPNTYRLTAASPNLRMVLTLFLLMTALGFATNMAMTYQQTHFDLKGISEYYRGAKDASGELIVYPKSVADLLWNSHVHLFMMPVVLLILCHIFYMTSAPGTLKKGLTWIVFLSAFAEVGAPWLIRFVSPAFAVVMALSGSLLGIGMLALMAVPLYEIWCVPRESNGPRGEREDAL